MSLGRLTVLVLALLAGVAGIAWVLDTRAQSERVRGSLSHIAGDAKGLTVRGWTDTNSLDDLTQDLRFYWTFENHSSTSIDIKITDFHPAGFKEVQGLEQSFALGPGQLKMLALILHPAAGGQFRLTGRYQSTAKDGKTEKVVAGETTLGPVDVATPARRLIHVAQQIYLVLKDLALPILLAFLAYFFQRRQKHRDDDLARQVEDREYRVELLKLQLPRFQEKFVEKHYLAIVRSLRLLQEEAAAAAKKTPLTAADLEPLLFRLALFLKRMQLLRDEFGGVFFQARQGELILQNAWFGFNYHVEEKVGTAERDTILTSILVGDDYVAFKTKATPAFVNQVLVKLETWVKIGNNPAKGGLVNCMDLAHIIRSVLIFETNRPLNQYWYDKPSTLGFKAHYEMPTEPKEKFDYLTKELPLYRTEVANYIAKKTPTVS